MSVSRNMSLWGRLALLTTSIIWGTSFVVLKNTLDSFGPLWLLCFRFSVSAVILLLCAGKRLKTASGRCIKGGIFLGLLLATAYLVQTFGLVYTTPSKNAFLTATYCVLTPFFAWFIYKRNPGISRLVAAFLCIAGIGFVTLSEGITEINFGDILTLFCGVFYAFQIIVMEQYGSSGDSVTLSAIEFSTAAVYYLVGGLLFEELPGAVYASAWFNLLYLSLACTALCFFLQAWGMKYTDSSTAAMLMTLEAVFAALFSILFFHEPVSFRLILGFILIFLAALCCELRPFDRKNE